MHAEVELELIQSTPAIYGGRTWILVTFRCPNDGEVIQSLLEPHVDNEAGPTSEQGTAEAKSSDAE